MPKLTREQKHIYDNIKDYLTIIIDTQEKVIDHILYYFENAGIKFIYRKLDFGDYSFQIDYNGQIKTFEAMIAIERKNSLQEIATNFGKNRKRFINEFERAKAKGAKNIIMIERDNYDNVINYADSGFNADALRNSLFSFVIRYDTMFNFVSKAGAGDYIFHALKCYFKIIMRNKK